MKAALPILPFFKVMDDHERLCCIALTLVEFLTPREKHLLIQMRGSAARLFDLGRADLAQLLGRRLVTREWRPDELLQTAERIRARLTADGTRSILYWDPQYPPQLREIHDPPVTLYLRGSLPGYGKALAGIVGTRFPTGAARQAAFELGFDLGRAGVVVVSGLARGIDREAHEGCEQAGGQSVAVLGNGIDLIYPSSSRRAARALLARGGGIVSEYPPGIPPLKWHFPARNRIISGLSRGVVIVQAPDPSGALFTAEYALEQGRDLWVHAAGLVGSSGMGTRRLAEQGAPVIGCAASVLGEWDYPVTEGGGTQTDGELASARRAGEIEWRT